MEYIKKLLISLSVIEEQPTESMEIVHFSNLPMNEWFRLDHDGNPSMGMSRKISLEGAVIGNQYMVVGEKQVWWVRNHTPHWTQI